MFYVYLWIALMVGIMLGMLLSALLRSNDSAPATRTPQAVELSDAEIVSIGASLVEFGAMLASGKCEHLQGLVEIHDFGDNVYCLNDEFLIRHKPAPKVAQPGNGRSFIGQGAANAV